MSAHSQNTLAPKMQISVPFRAVLISVVALWVTYFAIATLRWAVIADHDAFEMMKLRSIVTLCGIVITLFLWLLLRLFDARPLWMKVGASVVLALPVALLMAQVNHTVFSQMNAKMEGQAVDQPKDGPGQMFPDAPSPAPDNARPSPSSEPPLYGDSVVDQPQNEKKYADGFLGLLQQLTEITFSRYFMMLAWSAIYFSMLATAQVRVAERREQMFRNAAKAAELRSLRYQVNPHFLFNTLNSLSALVMTGKAEQAERMIQTISSFYRHSLTNEPTSDVPLEQEFDLQRHYLNIEEVRFPERLKAQFDLPDDLADARVPG